MLSKPKDRFGRQPYSKSSLAGSQGRPRRKAENKLQATLSVWLSDPLRTTGIKATLCICQHKVPYDVAVSALANFSNLVWSSRC